MSLILCFLTSIQVEEFLNGELKITGSSDTVIWVIRVFPLRCQQDIKSTLFLNFIKSCFPPIKSCVILICRLSPESEKVKPVFEICFAMARFDSIDPTHLLNLLCNFFSTILSKRSTYCISFILTSLNLDSKLFNSSNEFTEWNIDMQDTITNCNVR